jgi:hypothetical protein
MLTTSWVTLLRYLLSPNTAHEDRLEPDSNPNTIHLCDATLCPSFRPPLRDISTASLSYGFTAGSGLFIKFPIYASSGPPTSEMPSGKVRG